MRSRSRPTLNLVLLPVAAAGKLGYCFAVANAKASEFNPDTLSIRLLALLEKLSRSAGKADVHHLRTTVRRLEVQLSHPPSDIAKSLKKLRRQAGKVRDIDVHLDLLAAPLLPAHGHGAAPAPAARAQEKLHSVLQKKRDRKRSALRAVVKKSAPRLEAELPDLIESHPQPAFTLQEARQRASRARQRFLQWTHHIPSDEQGLHRLRIRAKKERYLLEPMQNCEEAVELAEKFKQVQDAIGQWHDWATLAELAEGCFERSSDATPVLQALHARVGREYRRALRSAQSVRSWIMGRKPVAPASSAQAGPRLVRKAG